MLAPPGDGSERKGTGPRISWILIGLSAGLALGSIAAAVNAPLEGALSVTGLIGQLWLDALRMTIVPLVVSLLVTGISSAASTASSGGVAGRALVLFVVLLLLSGIIGAFLGSTLLGAWAPPQGALETLKASAGAGSVPELPSATEWLHSIVPTNVVSAAAEGAIVPLTVFAVLLGLAIARMPAESSQPLRALFASLTEAMLTIVRWVLLIAPIGVFALAFGVGAKVGLGAGAVLAQYVVVQIVVTLVLCLSMYPLAVVLGRVRPLAFVKAALPAQAVAASTQSSLAALPPMIAGAQRLNLLTNTAPVVLPLAVAIFRIAAPASIVVVTLALGRMAGVEIGSAQIAVVVVIAVINTLVIAGLPNQITFFAAYAPPALAAGVPIEFLPLMLAVDTIPDIFYTVSNVTADLAVTAVAGKKRNVAGQVQESQDVQLGLHEEAAEFAQQ